MRKYRLALVFCGLATMARAEEEAARVIPSPDKKWEYRVVEDKPVIVKAPAGEMALDFDVGTALATETGRVVWAPDSRRLAFNFRAGGHYYTCALYELVGEEWKLLPSLEENAPEVSKMIERSERRDRKALGLTKDAHSRSVHDEWKVVRWLDQDTFEAYAASESTVVMKKKGEEDLETISGQVVFTVKCDNRGGWNIRRLREPTPAEAAKISRETESPD